MFEQFDDVMSAADVAEALYTDKNRVYELLHSGNLKGFRIGRTRKMPKESLTEYICRQSGLKK